MCITICVMTDKFIFFNFLHCCDVWGYTVAFTQVLTLYQIYQTWIHLLRYCPSSPPPDSWRSFSRYHFFIYLQGYNFLHHIHLTSPSHYWQPYSLGSTCSTLLFSNFVGEKEKRLQEEHDIFPWKKVTA
jgi:hypothetical protein